MCSSVECTFPDDEGGTLNPYSILTGHYSSIPHVAANMDECKMKVKLGQPNPTWNSHLVNSKEIEIKIRKCQSLTLGIFEIKIAINF